MADVDATNDTAFDIEEDGADALVADFIVSALDHVDGTQGYEEEGARLYLQQPHAPHVWIIWRRCWLKGSTNSWCCERILDAFLSCILGEWCIWDARMLWKSVQSTYREILSKGTVARGGGYCSACKQWSSLSHPVPRIILPTYLRPSFTYHRTQIRLLRRIPSSIFF